MEAYTYFHVPMVAGIIAAADELAIARSGDQVSTAMACLILGGLALYLLGNALFKWALWDSLARSRLVAIVALAASIPLALVSSAFGLLAAATTVIVAVAWWDTRAPRRLAANE